MQATHRRCPLARHRWRYPRPIRWIRLRKKQRKRKRNRRWQIAHNHKMRKMTLEKQEWPKISFEIIHKINDIIKRCYQLKYSWFTWETRIYIALCDTQLYRTTLYVRHASPYRLQLHNMIILPVVTSRDLAFIVGSLCDKSLLNVTSLNTNWGMESFFLCRRKSESVGYTQSSTNTCKIVNSHIRVALTKHFVVTTISAGISYIYMYRTAEYGNTVC